MKTEYVLRFHTNKYAGNWEREFFSFVTGNDQNEECPEPEINDAFEEEFGKAIVLEIAGILGTREHEEYGPQSGQMCSNPAWFNDGFGNHYRVGKEVEAEKSYRLECLRKAEHALRNSHPNSMQRDYDHFLGLSRGKFVSCLAYLSMEIYFTAPPTGAAARAILGRAAAFFDQRGIECETFNLCKEVTTLVATEMPIHV
jgi:hypothetical protein